MPSLTFCVGSSGACTRQFRVHHHKALLRRCTRTVPRATYRSRLLYGMLSSRCLQATCHSGTDSSDISRYSSSSCDSSQTYTASKDYNLKVQSRSARNDCVNWLSTTRVGTDFESRARPNTFGQFYSTSLCAATTTRTFTGSFGVVPKHHMSSDNAPPSSSADSASAAGPSSGARFASRPFAAPRQLGEDEAGFTAADLIAQQQLEAQANEAFPSNSTSTNERGYIDNPSMPARRAVAAVCALAAVSRAMPSMS